MEELLSSPCEIRHSQSDKFSPWRWVTQASVSRVGPPSGAESTHTHPRVVIAIVVGFQLTSYWPSRSGRSSNRRQQSGPRQACTNTSKCANQRPGSSFQFGRSFETEPNKPNKSCQSNFFYIGKTAWRNQPVVQWNEVEVGNLDRRPQLEGKKRGLWNFRHGWTKLQMKFQQLT